MAAESSALLEPVGGTTSNASTLYARRRIYLIYLAPAFASFLFGYSIGGISGSVASINAMCGGALTPMQISALTSASVVGASVSSAMAFYVADPLGARHELIVGSVLYLLATLLTELSHYITPVFSTLYALLYAGQFIYGLGIGFSMHAAPMYIGEISPPDVRGALVALKEGFIVLGMVAGFGAVAVADGAMADRASHWKPVWAVPGVVAVGIFSLMLCVAPSSPRWLLLRGRPSEALTALRFLLPGSSESALAEQIDEMLTVAPSAGKGDAPDARARCDGPCSASECRQWSTLCSSSRRPLVAGLGLVFLQQITGQPTVLYYAQSIFLSTGMSATTATHSDLIVGVAKLVATLSSVLFVDSVGRRPLLFVGITIMGLSLLTLTIGFGVSGGETMSVGWSSTVVVALIAYVTGYQIGFGPITWVLISELFPMQTRARAIGLSVCFNFVCNFLLAFVNEPLAVAVGRAPLFGFFGVMCVVSLLFVHACVPETKGKSLEEIEGMMRGTRLPKLPPHVPPPPPPPKFLGIF